MIEREEIMISLSKREGNVENNDIVSERER